jgi:hypothetical protein
MRHSLIKTIAASGLLLSGSIAAAQYQPRAPYSFSQVQDEREVLHHDQVFDRVQGDLARAHSGALPFTADRDRVARAQDEVNHCQRAVATGDFDRRDFDQAIGAIQRVTDLNRLSDRTRDFLLADVRELRDLQDHLAG